MLKKKLKKWWLLYIILAIVLYLIVGASAPFIHYKKMPAEAPNTAVNSDNNWEAFLKEEDSHDRAMLLESNLSAWEERIRLLNQAEERIILSTFDMRDGQSTRDLLAVIYHKAEEGVKVKILVDGISGMIRINGNALFYAVSSHPNIEIKLYNPLNLLKPWTTQGRMHDKYVIADNKAYIIGGRNTMDYFIGEYETKNRSFDREVLVYSDRSKTSENSSLKQVEDYFNGVWNLEVCESFHDKESLAEKGAVKEEIAKLKDRYQNLYNNNRGLFAQDDYYDQNTVPVDAVKLLSNPTGIYGKEPTLFFDLFRLLKQAKERVIIHTPYVVINDAMKDTLEELKDCVPDCKIILNSVENGDNFVASSDYLIHKGDILETGIACYEYDGGISYHGKSMVMDSDISVIGSYNLDLRSSYMDTELMLVIKSEELTRQLAANMDVIERDCRKVIDEKNYEVPEHIIVKEIPLWKKAAFRIAGFILQPFRFLI